MCFGCDLKNIEVAFGNCIFQKKSQVHRMTQTDAAKSKVPHTCKTTPRESQISFRFALQSHFFGYFLGFWFLHMVNVTFWGKSIKMGNSVSKIPKAHYSKQRISSLPKCHKLLLNIYVII